MDSCQLEMKNTVVGGSGTANENLSQSGKDKHNENIRAKTLEGKKKHVSQGMGEVPAMLETGDGPFQL